MQISNKVLALAAGILTPSQIMKAAEIANFMVAQGVKPASALKQAASDVGVPYMAMDKAVDALTEHMFPTATVGDVMARINTELAMPAQNLDRFETELETGTNLMWDERFGIRVKQTPINTWICTDTEVGVYAYHFDGKFVALSFQMARKNGVEFRWASEADAVAVRDFIRSLDEMELKPPVHLIDATEKISSDWLAERT